MRPVRSKQRRKDTLCQRAISEGTTQGSGRADGTFILCDVVGKVLSEKVTYEQRSEEGEQVSFAGAKTVGGGASAGTAVSLRPQRKLVSVTASFSTRTFVCANVLCVLVKWNLQKSTLQFVLVPNHALLFSIYT